MKIFGFLVLFALLFQGYAQDTVRCKQNNIPLTEHDIRNREIFEKKIQNAISLNRRTEANLYTIPVVVHVVYNSNVHNINDDQIQSQIDVLNKDFTRNNSDTSATPAVFRSIAASSDIQFKLALRDPQGKPTSGITRTFTSKAAFSDNDDVKFTSRGGKDAWDPSQYLNIWVCNLQGTVLGYYPNDYVSTVGTAADGVVIAYRVFGTIGPISTTYNLGRTATHEVGHWFGLYHLWGPPSSAPTATQCSSDMVDDTPLQLKESVGCPRFPYIDSVPCYNYPHGRNFSNFMDYSYDACMNMFTQGQVNRMRTVLTLNRLSILSSNALVPPFNKDLSVSLSFDTLKYCKGNLPVLKVRIFNNGKDTVKNFVIVISVNGQSNQYPWNGKLFSLKDTILIINNLNLPAGKLDLRAEVAFVSPDVDANPVNNADSLQFECNNTLSIYPNPVQEKVYFRGSLVAGIKSCTVYNLSGAQVLKVNNPTEIDVTGLVTGFYLIVLETNEKALRHQLIVIR